MLHVTYPGADGRFPVNHPGPSTQDPAAGLMVVYERSRLLLGLGRPQSPIAHLKPDIVVLGGHEIVLSRFISGSWGLF